MSRRGDFLRVRPIFFGQAATRQVLQSRKSAQCLFSIQHLMASRGLPPAFGQRRPTLLNQEKRDAPALALIRFQDRQAPIPVQSAFPGSRPPSTGSSAPLLCGVWFWTACAMRFHAGQANSYDQAAIRRSAKTTMRNKTIAIDEDSTIAAYRRSVW